MPNSQKISGGGAANRQFRQIALLAGKNCARPYIVAARLQAADAILPRECAAIAFERIGAAARKAVAA